MKCKNSKFDDNPEITTYLQVKDSKNSNNDEIKLPLSNLSVVLDKNIQFTDTMNGSRLYDDVFFSGNRVVSGSFDHYHVGSYSSEEACKEAQKEAKVLVTNQNSKVVCIEIKRWYLKNGAINTLYMTKMEKWL